MAQLHADKLNALGATLSIILFVVFVVLGLALVAVPIYTVALLDLDSCWFFLIIPSAFCFGCSYGIIDNLNTNLPAS